jgi:hypothetical protein
VLRGSGGDPSSPGATPLVTCAVRGGRLASGRMYENLPVGPRAHVALAALLAGLACSGDPSAPEDPKPELHGLDAFLDTCPTDDPAWTTISQDFSIWRDKVRVESLPCSGPVSSIPIEKWTRELTLAQTLRAIYYVQGSLPWTELSLYEWMRESVSGFDITTGYNYASCCRWLPDERPRLAFGDGTEEQRDADRRPEGILGEIGLLVHETRHAFGYPHTDCCTAGPAACDQRYDAADPSAYAVQHWVLQALRAGALETGYACLEPVRTSSIRFSLALAANEAATRFCEDAPAPLPQEPPPACESTPPFETGVDLSP